MNAILDMTVRDALRSMACYAFMTLVLWLPFLWWLARNW